MPAGSAAVFPCMASGYPTPDIAWSKVKLGRGPGPGTEQMQSWKSSRGRDGGRPGWEVRPRPGPQCWCLQLDGDLPPDSRLDNNMMMLPSVRPQDAGTYICTATNRQGKVKAFVHLQVPGRTVAILALTVPAILHWCPP